MTPPAAPPTTRWPTSSAVPLIQRTWPRGICGRHPSRSPNSWQGSHSSATCPHCRLISTHFLHNLHSRCWPPPPWPPARPHPHLTLHPTSSHPWSGGHHHPPLTNNNNNPSHPEHKKVYIKIQKDVLKWRIILNKNEKYFRDNSLSKPLKYKYEL